MIWSTPFQEIQGNLGFDGDKAKGIIAKSVPREWYDRHSAVEIEDSDRKDFYLKIIADKKPYFFRYIYPNTDKEYTDFVKNTAKKCIREFSVKIDCLLNTNANALTDEQKEFLRYYDMRMPVGTNGCVMNRICRRFEDEFDGKVAKSPGGAKFDYSILKSGAVFTKAQFDAVQHLYDDFNRRVRDYIVFAKRERVDDDEAAERSRLMYEEFRAACDAECPNPEVLCDIVLDICYSKNSTKRFAWTMCGKEIIDNLLRKNGFKIRFPVKDENGDIEYGGEKFSMQEKKLEVM